jgi:hypothetical protein
MGQLEQEVVVHGKVRSVENDHAVVESEAEQNGKRIIRNGEADVRLS